MRTTQIKKEKYNLLSRNESFIQQFWTAKQNNERLLSLEELGAAFKNKHISPPPHIYTCGTLLAFSGQDTPFRKGQMNSVSEDGVYWSLEIPEKFSNKKGFLIINPEHYDILVNSNMLKISIDPNKIVFADIKTIDYSKVGFNVGNLDYTYLNIHKTPYLGPIKLGYFDDTDILAVISFLNDVSYDAYTKPINA